MKQATFILLISIIIIALLLTGCTEIETTHKEIPLDDQVITWIKESQFSSNEVDFMKSSGKHTSTKQLTTYTFDENKKEHSTSKIIISAGTGKENKQECTQIVREGKSQSCSCNDTDYRSNTVEERPCLSTETRKNNELYNTRLTP